MDKPLSLTQVADIVQSEGLGYAITNYLSADNISDPELRNLWDHAGRIMKNIEELLEGYETDSV